jgi:hypothetical protein
MLAPEPLHACTAAPTVHKPKISAQNIAKPVPFGPRSAWLHFANEIEIRHLAKLHGRINRRKESLDDLISERQRIMNRCIRRMRRKNGKN